MKKIVIIVLFMLMCVSSFGAFTTSMDKRSTYKNSYRWTGKPKDKLLLWAKEVEDRADGTAATEFTFYTPTDTEPATNEGTIYYDLSEHKLKFRNASSWVAIEAGSSGNSLDGAYNIGRSITVDEGVVTLTGTNAGDNIVLAIVQADTGSTVAQTITSAGTGALLTFDSNGTGGDLLGSDSTWSVSKAGAFVGVTGVWTGDQTWTGSTANVLFDATDDELLIEDSAVLSFGDAADVTFTWNATNLLIEAATDNIGQMQIGATNAIDLKIVGSTNTDIALFDANPGILLMDSYPIALGDGDSLFFGDVLGTGDFSIVDTADKWVFDAVVDGTGEIEFGNDADDLPMKWYTDTTGDWVYFNDDEVEFEDCILQMMDATQIQFGDGDDFAIHSTTAKQLQFSPAAATDDYEVLLGVDQSGVDIKAFGATTGEFFLWDASADTCQVVGGNMTVTTSDAEANQFKVNATGAVAGIALQLETTSGGIHLLADHSDNGDITLDAEDDIILITTGALTITNTDPVTISGALSPNGAVLGDGGDTLFGFRREVEVEPGTAETLTAADSGKVFANTATNGVTTYTLPAAAAGLTFTFVDVSAQAADDVRIQAVGDDKINGGTAAKIYESVTDAIPATVTITAIDATNWHVTSEAGTWANNNA